MRCPSLRSPPPRWQPPSASPIPSPWATGRSARPRRRSGETARPCWRRHATAGGREASRCALGPAGRAPPRGWGRRWRRVRARSATCRPLRRRMAASWSPGRRSRARGSSSGTRSVRRPAGCAGRARWPWPTASPRHRGWPSSSPAPSSSPCVTRRGAAGAGCGSPSYAPGHGASAPPARWRRVSRRWPSVPLARVPPSPGPRRGRECHGAYAHGPSAVTDGRPAASSSSHATAVRSCAWRARRAAGFWPPGYVLRAAPTIRPPPSPARSSRVWPVRRGRWARRTSGCHSRRPRRRSATGTARWPRWPAAAVSASASPGSARLGVAQRWSAARASPSANRGRCSSATSNSWRSRARSPCP
jgi:hypothetical protein